ncbi:MAG: methylated-DNA--[protein]-cysteine S-methyltransferase [Deltaproteobacteria bacterium]|jgi:methylated-DNA-[protein]-cysteine S-methyltransferase|nr:methylated-DNA--[protein]-cysteine S-methyltransferase [Deltaproteobacteria bacterium]
MILTLDYPSPIGRLTLAAKGESLIGLWIEGQKYHGAAALGGQKGESPILVATRAWLERYFAGERPAVEGLTLAPEGTQFRRAVWAQLREIPYGSVISYSELARRLAGGKRGVKTSARAVGGAVGRNPISILIPCHRVVGANGDLTGYAGGLGVKARLLQLEGLEVSGQALPKEALSPRGL